MAFASPFPDVDIPDVNVYDLLFTDIDPPIWTGLRSSMSRLRQRLRTGR